MPWVGLHEYTSNHQITAHSILYPKLELVILNLIFGWICNNKNMSAIRFKPFINTTFRLLKQTFQAYSADKVPRLGAALAYYAVFSLAPLLIISIAVAGFVFGPEAARGEIVGQFRGLLGETGARLVETMLEEAYSPARGILASVLGVATLLLGATGVFNQLQEAMNTIWDVPAQEQGGLIKTLKDRLVSVALVMATGFLLLTSLLLSAGITALSRFLTDALGPSASTLLGTINFTLSFLITTVMFATMFKVLPDSEVRWGDVWLGGALTALLFSIGKLLIGLYLGNASLGSTYGAAGSLAILLVWIYYSAQIFFLGAEFTYVHAHQTGPWQAAAGSAVMPIKRPGAVRPSNGQAPITSSLSPEALENRPATTRHTSPGALPASRDLGSRPWFGLLVGAALALLLYFLDARRDACS